MKNSTRMFVLTEVVLAAMLILMAVMLFLERNGQDPEKITVIVPDSSSAQWSAFRYGLKAAAEDEDVDVFVASTERHLSAGDEMELMSYEADEGAAALIVQAVPGMDIEEAAAKIGKKIPLMLINCEEDQINGNNIPSTGSDGRAMGAELAEGLLEDCGGGLDGKRIGLVLKNDERGSLSSREEGFRNALEGSGGVIAWSADILSEEELSLKELPAVDFVAALDDRSLVAAGKAAALNDLHGALVYGIGNSTEAVYYLDMGDVECLVVPDDFQLGYQSLAETAKRLKRRFYTMSGSTVSHTVLRREDLFLEENQEILFTMNQ